MIKCITINTTWPRDQKYPKTHAASTETTVTEMLSPQIMPRTHTATVTASALDREAKLGLETLKTGGNSKMKSRCLKIGLATDYTKAKSVITTMTMNLEVVKTLNLATKTEITKVKIQKVKKRRKK